MGQIDLMKIERGRKINSALCHWKPEREYTNIYLYLYSVLSKTSLSPLHCSY